MKLIRANVLIPILLLLVGSTAIASGVFRFSSLVDGLSSGSVPSAPEGMQRYIEHPLLSILHLLPGILFMLLGPLQLLQGVRRRWPKVHRWSGRLFLVSGLLVGLSAVLMALIFPILENRLVMAANIIFGTALMVFLVLGFSAIIQRDISRHRAWMIRAYGVGLSVGSMRVIMGGLFLVMGEAVMEYISLSALVWSVFLLNMSVAECYLRCRVKRSLPVVA